MQHKSQLFQFAHSLFAVLLFGMLAGGETAQAELPATDATIQVETQEWPFKPGPRTVPVYVYYPGGKLENVQSDTGLMLNLHNWGGKNTSGAGDPKQLTAKLNVIAISVDYIQSGRWDATKSEAPYDFGYLQAIDALRGLSHVYRGLTTQGIQFDKRRIYSSGGSGGGNVTLMCNKLAPHTFTCIVDICGMPKLSDDIAFNLPGGSYLNAGYSKDPKSPKYLHPGRKELHFVGNPKHLQVMKDLGTETKIVVIHGSGDKVCPYEHAVEMVNNFKIADFPIEAIFVRPSDIDGDIFKSTGHSLGNRTKMMTTFGGKYMLPDSKHYAVRQSPTDFDLQKDIVYPTSDGRFVISYTDGIPSAKFEPSTK